MLARILPLAAAFLLPLPAQSEDLHPVLEALLGTWEEKGMLIPAKGAPPIQGTAKFTAVRSEDGKDLTLKGSADFGKIKWDYAWSYAPGSSKRTTPRSSPATWTASARNFATGDRSTRGAGSCS